MAIIILFVMIVIFGIAEFIVALTIKTILKNFTDHHFKNILNVIEILDVESFHDVAQILVAFLFC